MRIRLVALGHRMPGWVAEGYADYAKRLPRDYPLELVELKPEARDRGKSVEQLLRTEAVRIRAACEGYCVVALDERGKAWTTRELADRLRRWHDESTDVAFVIGSSDGLDASVKHDAAHVVALSSLTLPHALVRVLVAEQLYRATSLIAGHPYHRE